MQSAAHGVGRRDAHGQPAGDRRPGQRAGHRALHRGVGEPAEHVAADGNLSDGNLPGGELILPYLQQTTARLQAACRQARGQGGVEPDNLVGIPQNLPRLGLAPVDYEQNGIVVTREREAVEQIGQRASGRQRHVKTAQRALRRTPLQRRVQMNTDGDIYQLKILSRSDSAAS